MSKKKIAELSESEKITRSESFVSLAVARNYAVLRETCRCR